MSSTFSINFLKGATGYRIAHSHRGNELLAKAIGIKGIYKPTVVDATAGLGRDAFVLACLGCKVVMLERSTIIASLLEEGLQRLHNDPSFHKTISLTLLNMDAKDYFLSLEQEQLPDVIYLDPMFPQRTKSALVKKEMRLLREIVGDDEDSSTLLPIALKYAQKRVVVKRPHHAPTLTDLKPNFCIASKKQRFDIYLR